MTAVSPASTPPPTPLSPQLTASQKRRRTLIILASISIGWKVIVFTLGAAVPRWFIKDGIAELPAPVQPYAREAQQVARGLWNGRIERLGFVRIARVVSVDRTDEPAGAECDGLSARVRAYTYFAIPYSEVRTVCARGVVEYRVFRRKRRAR